MHDEMVDFPKFGHKYAILSGNYLIVERYFEH